MFCEDKVFKSQTIMFLHPTRWPPHGHRTIAICEGSSYSSNHPHECLYDPLLHSKCNLSSNKSFVLTQHFDWNKNQFKSPLRSYRRPLIQECIIAYYRILVYERLIRSVQGGPQTCRVRRVIYIMHRENKRTQIAFSSLNLV